MSCAVTLTEGFEQPPEVLENAVEEVERLVLEVCVTVAPEWVIPVDVPIVFDVTLGATFRFA